MLKEKINLSIATPGKRLSVQELPEVSDYLKRLLVARFSDPQSEQAQQYLNGLLATTWTMDKMRDRLDEAEDSTALSYVMRKLRQEVMLTLITKDLTGNADFEEVVSTMSNLARAVIQKTVYVYARELASRFGVPHSAEGVPQDLLVVGMGKLGGSELNVSSDIDLVFFYDEDGECKPTAEFPNQRKELSNYEFYERLAKRIIPAISDITDEGFVFRVDMRLRPNGDSGPIVGSVGMLEEYLLIQGREWERFAWLKGKVVNGPVFTTAEQFEIQKKNLEDTVRPFVYRKYLDFGAISSLTDLHAKIRKAAQKREQTSLVEGQNVKLGRGGIREIEFIAQTFQVIRAGRHPYLRSHTTLKALKSLGSEHVIEEEDAEKLSEAYIFLRTLEHALQYVNDEQTQLLPKDPEQRERISRMLGLSVEQLENSLSSVTDYVAKYFDSIFQTSEQTEEQDWPLGWDSGREEAKDGLVEVLRKLEIEAPEEAASKILTLMSVRALKLIKPEAKARMATLVQQVVKDVNKYVKESEGLISQAEMLDRYLKFLEVIAGRPTYVSLLTQYPKATKYVARVVGASSWATEYLLRHPLLLDEMLDERLSQIDDYTPVDFSDYIYRARMRLADIEDSDQEARMNLIREMHHARLFRLFLADLNGRLTVERLADQLSALADATLELSLEESWKTVPGRHQEVPAFSVIAYGKLGGKELGYASDLDLVFLYDDGSPDAEKIYTRLARRFLNWLTATTGSGVLFDVDMRLRPNGENGSLVCSLDSFKKYERNEDGTGAWLWEHQALTRARFSAGDRLIGQEFEDERISILTQKRDPVKTAEEVMQMRQRMHDGHPNNSELFDVKHDSGGMVDIEFIVQYLVLVHSYEHPELVNNFGNIKLLEMAAEAGLIDKDLASSVLSAYRDYRRIQHETRLNSPTAPVRVPKEPFSERITNVRKLWDQVFNVKN